MFRYRSKSRPAYWFAWVEWVYRTGYPTAGPGGLVGVEVHVEVAVGMAVCIEVKTGVSVAVEGTFV